MTFKISTTNKRAKFREKSPQNLKPCTRLTLRTTRTDAQIGLIIETEPATTSKAPPYCFSLDDESYLGIGASCSQGKSCACVLFCFSSKNSMENTRNEGFKFWGDFSRNFALLFVVDILKVINQLL
jgi:hypothetical protein